MEFVTHAKLGGPRIVSFVRGTTPGATKSTYAFTLSRLSVQPRAGLSKEFAGHTAETQLQNGERRMVLNTTMTPA